MKLICVMCRIFISIKFGTNIKYLIYQQRGDPILSYIQYNKIPLKSMSNISYESPARNRENHEQTTMNDRNTAWSGSPLIRRNRDITFQWSFFFKGISMMNLGFAEIFTTSRQTQSS